jgi:GMP synthase (glutamine-hydrolysing)
MIHPDKIVILDFGSQYTKLIARRIRDLHVYSEILPFSADPSSFMDSTVRGVILSGGPRSVLAEDAPQPDPKIFDLKVPTLGICYGLQLLCQHFGGQVENAEHREYGPAELSVISDHVLFSGLNTREKVWMSHGDRLENPPAGFVITGSSENAPVTAMAHETRDLMGLQFHPEVSHTQHGQRIISNFLFKVCHCQANWKMEDFIDSEVERIQRVTGNHEVLLGLSGGVDSSVAAALIDRAIGKQLTCVFVDTGLLRKNEARDVVDTFQRGFGLHLVHRDATKNFFDGLKGVSDPEKKRKFIGRMFIEIFEEEAAKLDHPEFLAQGTLYPDVIESATGSGPAQTIKSHHNVGGLPEKMNMKLLEPLRDLFKDEVRSVGRILGVPEEIVGRHPFPGPGLAVRIMGEVLPEDVLILQEADAVFINLLKEFKLYDRVSQAFAVLLPVQTVGIMGDERTYEKVCALRAVTTSDFMTADWSRLPDEFLAEVSRRIVNQVKGINRVVYDITSKPPGTIEWE